MIKETLSLSTNALTATASKERLLAENNPTEAGLFGLVLQTVQQINEEPQAKGQTSDEGGKLLEDTEIPLVGADDKDIIQDTLVSEHTVKAHQPPQATESIAKLKQSLAKIAQNQEEGNKNVIVAEMEQDAELKDMDNANTDTEIAGKAPKNTLAEHAILNETTEALTQMPVLDTSEQEGEMIDAIKIENSSTPKVELAPILTHIKTAGSSDIDSNESLVVEETKLDALVESEVKNVMNIANQVRDLEVPSTSSIKSEQATEALKGLDELLQKVMTLKDRLIQNVEEVVKEVDSDNAVEKIPAAKLAEGTIEFANELLGSKTELMRTKRYTQQHISSPSSTAAGDRIALVTEQTAARGPANQDFEFSNLRVVDPSSMQTDSGISLTKDQEMLLKDQMIESAVVTEIKNSNQYNMGYLSLGEIPVNNLSIRRNVLPNLTQIMRTTSQGKGFPETWQKHSFELEDGNKIQLSTRNVDGLIQVKLASSSPELSKLMQMHGHDIKSHLEKECELSIDLQFESQPEQNMDNFFGDSFASPQNQGPSLGKQTSTQNAKQTMGQPIQQSVRKFGYNQMEWTV